MPIIGHIDKITINSVAGWAADTDDLGTPLALIVSVNGVDIGRVTAGGYRVGLERILPGASGNYFFEYGFLEGLSPFQTYTITVRTTPGNKLIDPGIFQLKPTGKTDATPPEYPISPLFISSVCDVSSRLAMAILATHDSIVVGGQDRRGAQPTTHYGRLSEAHSAPGDSIGSLTDMPVGEFDIDVDLRLGFNKAEYFDRFRADSPVRRLAAAYRNIVVDFYNAVAIDQEKLFPLYFVERLPERGPARALFPGAKEIILVRDLRDTLVSVIQSSGADFDAAFEAVRATAEPLMAIDRSSPDIFVVKYEELVRDPTAILGRIDAFLGLPFGFGAEAIDLTTRRAGEPDGGRRGARDFGQSDLARLSAFDEFHRRFDYPAANEPIPAYVRPLVTDLPAAASPIAEPDLQTLMTRFESLGENCEFGLVQRRCGAEPLGLFRFASAPLPNLIALLEARFEGFTAPENLDVQLSENGREFMIADRRFGLLYHAWVLAGEMTPDQIHAREVRRLPLLVRKLIEDLTAGHKIFVCHGMVPMATGQMAGLLAQLRKYGPGTLLWVELANADNAPGSVRWMAPGLLRGFIDRLAPAENAHDLSLDCWIAICRDALRLHRAAADTPDETTTGRARLEEISRTSKSVAGSVPVAL